MYQCKAFEFEPTEPFGSRSGKKGNGEYGESAFADGFSARFTFGLERAYEKTT